MVANILERSDRFLNKYLEFDVKDSNYDYAKSFNKQIPNTKNKGLVKYYETFSLYSKHQAKGPLTASESQLSNCTWGNRRLIFRFYYVSFVIGLRHSGSFPVYVYKVEFQALAKYQEQ